MEIITSLLDNDLYKFSMQQAVFHQYPKSCGRYDLAVRTSNPAIKLAYIIDQIRDAVMSLESLRLEYDEHVFLRSTPWFKHDYLDWLSTLRLNPSKDIKVEATIDGGITISISGMWKDVILYEVPVLAIIEEIYCSMVSHLTPDQAEKKAIKRLSEKVILLNRHPRLSFSDFGTRRRYSKHIHKAVLTYLKANCHNMVGTSNLAFAKELGLKAVGTMAHEFIMAHLALVDRLNLSQKRALHVWQQEYGQSLGVALTDTFTTEVFWRDFDFILSSSFSGVRQDSGDPFKFGHEAIAHYKKMGIDPKTKSIIFSDSLDFPKMIALFEEFTGLIGIGFGIGTDLTNSVDVEPLSIVIKLMELNNTPLVKLSDVVGKTMGNPSMVARVKTAYGL
jgi:nicotinate phosphoribosyltransferase